MASSRNGDLDDAELSIRDIVWHPLYDHDDVMSRSRGTLKSRQRFDSQADSPAVGEKLTEIQAPKTSTNRQPRHLISQSFTMSLDGTAALIALLAPRLSPNLGRNGRESRLFRYYQH